MLTDKLSRGEITVAVFNELVKNHERIRGYIRDFLVYGYKSRNDYDKKSSRSYDNERRRIESYLTNYIRGEHSPRGKRMFIVSDIQDIEENPLHKTWMTKSFTRNDIMLHFMILDILQQESQISVNDLADLIHDRYFSKVDMVKMPDTMTIRNKLKEYTLKGYLQSTKKGRTLCYSLTPSPIGEMEEHIRKQLFIACGYYQNVMPVGIIGSFIRQKLSDIEPIAAFSFRHFYIAHTLDDGILLTLLHAMKSHSWVDIHTFNKRQGRLLKLKILPLRFVQNVNLGRRYIGAYSYYMKKYGHFRLDAIEKVVLGHPVVQYEEHLDNLLTLREDCWAVNIYHSDVLESVKMTLHIDEVYEQYLIQRIHREGRHGELTRITVNTYKYEILVIDANEMVPWLRTFIGRMIAFECSNASVEQRFISDILKMINMYGG